MISGRFIMKTVYIAISADILNSYKPIDVEKIDALLNAEIAANNKKIVVLDDDPTGVQTVHDITVYTGWDKESILDGFNEENNLFYILTNSRGFTVEQTTQAHKEIAAVVDEVAKETGKEYIFISRSDSTLRGHFPLETQLLREAYEANTGKKIGGEILCPFFKEGGRFTIGNVHVIFVPTYLNGNDGVLNLPYYDLLIGLDLTVFPSYYEPWGYTPLESMAFHVPTITTSLSGYGVWCEEQGCTTIDKGVAVIYRNDSNTDDVINHIVNTIKYYLSLTPRKVAAARKAAVELALQAEWKNFFTFYREAYAIALKKAAARQ